MTKKRVTAAILALMMSASLCACAKDDPAEDSDSKSAVTTEAAVTEEAEESAPEEAEAEADASEEEESDAPAATGEAAEVQKVVDAYAKALAEKDYDTLMDVTAIELIYYLTNGETGDRDAYMQCLKEQIVSEDGDYSGYTFSAPYLQDEYVEEYKSFFELMDEQSEGEYSLADKFKIDRVYATDMKATGITMDVPVIHVNGEWKCDPVVSMTMSFFDMFSDMADSAAEAE